MKSYINMVPIIYSIIINIKIIKVIVLLTNISLQKDIIFIFFPRGHGNESVHTI